MGAVIPLLIEAGHKVVGVDNFARYGRMEKERSYEFVEADLTDPLAVNQLMQGIDGVIQGAATIYGVGGFHKHPATILSNDLILHANCLRAAAANGVPRVVYISSSMVYERVDHTPTSEEDVERAGIPATDYGLSKLVGERMTKAFYDEFGVEYVIWRPFNIITPNEVAEDEIGVSHVFADFLEALLVKRQNPMPILGDGEQIRCFTWIGDVARGIADYSFSPEARNQTFNLGNPRPITMKELAQHIFTLAKQRGYFDPTEELKFEHRPIYSDDVRRRIPSVERAAEVLGWHPTVSLEEALSICVDQRIGSESVQMVEP